MSSDAKLEETWSSIEEIKKVLLSSTIDSDLYNYQWFHVHLAQLYYRVKEYSKTVYHLTECHGVLLRKYGILEDLRKERQFGVSTKPSTLKWEYLSDASEYVKEEELGLLRRLSEMPQEWTVVQLTRIPGEKDSHIIENKAVSMEQMFITRMQCGSNPDELLVNYLNLSRIIINILDEINEASNQLAVKKVHRCILKSRREGSEKIQGIIKDLDDDIFMYWKCLFLGRLENEALGKGIRTKINNVLEKHKVELSSRDKTLLYLMADGICYFSSLLVKSYIDQKLPGTTSFKTELHSVIMNLSEDFPELRDAKRHPVILIVEDHLDIVPWESMPILKEQAVTRVPSIHFLHALFKTHEKHIHRGLREISEGEINCYILNPDSDLMSSEARMKPFFDARLPKWKGVVGKKPTTDEISQLISSSNTYIYCGHGSGVHLLSGSSIQQMNLKNSVQFLFGCKSSALKYLGGVVPMMGDIIHFCIAGSACSIGMIYVVMNNDVDRMTANLVNIWLPGTPLNITTLDPLSDTVREPELLRVLPKVRKDVDLASNGLALIARGLPVKLVPDNITLPT